MKVLVAGDLNVSGFCRSLEAILKREDATWSVKDSSFNSWESDALNPNSLLQSEHPDFYMILLTPRILTDIPDIASRVQSTLEALKTSRGQARVLFSSIYVDVVNPQPFFENTHLQALAAQINHQLAAFQDENLWFQVLDFAAVNSLHGSANLTDARYEGLGRMYLSPKGAEICAQWTARVLSSLTKVPKKVLVLDLDNTLWGGVLGEDGPDGIECGGEGRGYGFLRFQKALIRLRANGVLLAICSKNNEHEVFEVFKTHPDLQLRIEDFAAFRINWEPKPENLKSLADELNLGLSSFVFFDDSAHECEAVRQALPEVDVILAPSEPAYYTKALFDYSGFDIFRVTDEDRKRSKQYQDEAKRQSVKRQSHDLVGFYNSLEMKAIIARVTENALPRVHQLINKTNQFNLTAQRLGEVELQSMIRDSKHPIYTLTLSDRMGESGLTGVAISHLHDGVWEITNLLMSCRIIGRTVEFAFMRFLSERARENGIKEMRARFVPSPRNQVASKYLQQSGFTEKGGYWTVQLPNEKLPKDYVRVEVR